MKKLVVLVLALVICMSMGIPAGFAAEAGSFTPGAYTAVGSGRNGPIVLEMEFDAHSITAVTVLSHKETWHIGNDPIEQYAKQAVDHQSLNLDVVSGATVSSVGMLEALRNGVTLAGGDPSALMAEIPFTMEAPADTEADVVVVGGGSAGMTAASYAAAAGKSVILLEKLDILGGTSTYSIEAYGAAESATARAIGTAATKDTMYEALVNGNPNGSPEAFRLFADNNGAGADWLRSIGGIMPVAGGGTSVTTSREAGKMGVTITGALKAQVKKMGVDVRLGNKATELVMENDVVVGVKVESDKGAYTISAPAVILTTGGFGANNAMVAEGVPALEGYDYACSPGATGDGHIMAEAAGAELKDMDYVRVNFTYHREGPVVYYMGALMNTGGIFVDANGQRIVNDQGGYGVGMQVVAAGGEGWAIMDQSMIDSIQDVREYYEMGLYESADTLEELAAKIGVDAEGLLATVERYKGFVKQGEDEDFGRRMLNLTFDEAPYYACRFTAHVQGTFGGISTDLNTRALRADGSVIPGLFAAGECASVGTWGANPMSVNIVFGRIAGEAAAAQ